MPKLIPLAAFLALGLALTTSTARGQKKFEDIKLTPRLDTEVAEMKKGETDFKPAAVRKTLDEYMAYFAEKIQHPDMFKPAQEFGATNLPMQNASDQLFSRVLVPEPGQKYTINQADYITIFGEAFVAAFKPLIESHSDRIVRLNAARLMSVAAMSGAPAFGPLITELLSNANTPAEVKFYAYKAAESLLAAFDIKQMAGKNPRDHSLNPTNLMALLKVLETNIYDPTKFVVFPQGIDPKQPPPEIGAVVSYIRRQAIRAYSRVRLAQITDGAGNTMQPAMVLAKIAMSDPALIPGVGPAEVAEAAIGLCSMQPTSTLMMDATADAVATALISFASALGNPNMESVVKTTPWKLYASRLRPALTQWKTLIANASVPENRFPKAASDVADAAIEAVVNPLEQAGIAGRNGMNLQKLVSARQAIRNNPAYKKLLFKDETNSSLAAYQK